MEGNNKSQLKAGAMLNYVVILLNTAVGLLYTPYMLRMLGQNEYGLYSLVASIIAYLTIFDFGLGNAAVRYTAKLRAENKREEQYELFGMFFILFLIIGAITLVAGYFLYANIEKVFGETMTQCELHKAKIMMVMLIFNLFFTFLMSIFGAIITAYEKFIFPRVVNICRVILNTAVMICLLKLGYKAIAMVVVQTVFNVLTLLLNYLYCKKRLQVKIRFGKIQIPFLKEIAIYSFWIFLNVIIDRIYWNTGQFVLGAIVGTAAVAVFAVSVQLHNMYMLFSSAIVSVFLPKVTAMVTTSDDKKMISDLFIRTGRIQFVALAFILSCFIVFGREFINLWAGAEYGEAYIISVILFVTLLIPYIQSIGLTILQARNQMKFRSLLCIGIAVISLVFQILFAKPFGGIGIAIAIASAFIAGQWIIMNIYYSKKQGLDILSFWKEICKMAVVPAIMTVLGLVLKSYVNIDSWFSLFAYIGMFSVVYLPLFWLFSMNSYEKRLVLSPINKILNRHEY